MSCCCLFCPFLCPTPNSLVINWCDDANRLFERFARQGTRRWSLAENWDFTFLLDGRRLYMAITRLICRLDDETNNPWNWIFCEAFFSGPRDSLDVINTLFLFINALKMPFVLRPSECTLWSWKQIRKILIQKCHFNCLDWRLPGRFWRRWERLVGWSFAKLVVKQGSVNKSRHKLPRDLNSNTRSRHH